MIDISIGMTVRKPPETLIGGKTNSGGQIYMQGVGWVTPWGKENETLENDGIQDDVDY